ncbi:MAG: hypothetical protein U1E65_00710 [Myxococcota bacterium]
MRAPLRLRALLAAGLCLAPSLPAAAEPPAPRSSAVLVGFELGASLLSPRPDARFRLGASAAWLNTQGATLEARGYVLHTLDLGGSLAIGALGPGLTDGEGLPLGGTFGAAFFREKSGTVSIGAHASLLLSLWVARALLALDADWVRTVDGTSDRVIVSLVLRGVPFRL